jgi:cell wall-associated NlpC family hydrolase
MPDLTTDREVAVWYLSRWIGRPYLWGGDDPLAGFDCSGLIVTILRAVGLLHIAEDLTADGLLSRFLNRPARALPGALAFWRAPSGKARHVEMLLTSRFTIGASGGGSTVLTIQDAIRENAFVQLRPLATRPGYILRDPFEEE